MNRLIGSDTEIVTRFLYSNGQPIFSEDSWTTPNTYYQNFKPVPKKSGVYLLVAYRESSSDGEIVYIGSSKNLSKRYSNHEVINKLEKSYWHVRFYFEECENYLEREKQLIKSIHPKYNITFNGQEIH